MSILINSNYNRVTIYLPSGMTFIVIVSILRFIEGFGTSLHNTTIIALLAHLYPNSLGTAFVNYRHVHVHVQYEKVIIEQAPKN